MKRVLLHICCGVCAFACIERLRNEGFYVEGFFYNPNIHPKEEYEKRKDALSIVREVMNIRIIEGKYNPKEWFLLCKNYAEEQEGGKRCSLCYRMRLEEAYSLSRKLGFEYFTTTLTVSPHKRSGKIFEEGEKISRKSFLKIDFKKKDGFKKTNELAKKYKVYHQNYCGCIYSLMERRNRNG